MPLFSKRRLDCFYCGKKSIQRYEYGLPRWKCENCQADNYLDANGEITEPPATPSTPSVTRTQRFAQALPRSVSPVHSATDQSPFCQTCLNNQYLVTQNLANYLPDTTDPRYADFEANLPTYKKQLEQRYPPVCADCEPRVKQRMRAAGDVAKADYLGRMMNKTRRVGFSADIWTPVFFMSTAGGFMWFFSTLALVVWNAFGALVIHTDFEDGLVSDIDDANIFQCIGQAAGFARVDTVCPRIASGLAGWGIVAALASIWWNPIMRRRNIDRAIGWGEFYKLQAILTLARLGSWYALQHDQSRHDPAVDRLVHATMLAMNMFVPILAYNTAKIARNPKISFHNREESYVTKSQSGAQVSHSNGRVHSDRDAKTVTTSTSISFPFSKIGDQEASRVRSSFDFTQEESDDMEDAMDIDTPEPKHNFRSTTSRIQQDFTQEPSPFYGTLPSAPISQEHKLRNPPNRPSFQKTSSQRQEKFFQSMTKQSAGVDDFAGSPGELRLDPPRLEIKQDNQETGLEGWFSSNVFSLGEPSVASLAPNPNGQGKVFAEPSSQDMVLGSTLNILPLIALICATAGWLVAPKSGLDPSLVRLLASGLATVVASVRLKTVLLSSVVNVSDILLCLLELFGAIFLGYRIWQATKVAAAVDDLLGFFPLFYFGGMIIQECLILVTSHSSSNRQTISAQIPRNAGPREKKPLELDNLTSALSSQPDSVHSGADPASLASADGRLPAAKGLSGPDLGFSGSTLQSSTASSAQRTTRALRARATKPWEVGGV